MFWLRGMALLDLSCGFAEVSLVLIMFHRGFFSYVRFLGDFFSGFTQSMLQHSPSLLHRGKVNLDLRD